LRGGPLSEGNLVRLIYTDEAGTSALVPVCVVAAIVVDGDSQWRPLEIEMRRIIAEKVPINLRPNFVFHATDVFSGSKKIDRTEWPQQERLDFLKEILCLPFVHDVPISVGIEFKRDWSDVVDFKNLQIPGSKPLNNNKFSHLLAFNNCMEKADLFLRKYLNGAEIGTVVAEDLPEMKNILTNFGLMQRGSENTFTLPSSMQRPNRMQELLGKNPEDYTYRIDHIVDVPNFVKKGKAPLLQLADACAFAFRHCLSKKDYGDDLLLAMLGPAEGLSFLNDPVWFSISGSGLFNTKAYWSEDQRQIVIAEQRGVMMRSFRHEIET
jgi:hypothetical protein